MRPDVGASFQRRNFLQLFACISFWTTVEVVVKKPIKPTFDPKAFLAKVGEGKKVIEYREDEIVYSQGAVADAVFYLQEGKVKLTVLSKQGKEAVIAILGPGQFFGEGCLNGHQVRIATTRAIEKSGLDRSIVQFERKASRPASPSPCKFRQGRQAGADLGKVQSGNAGGDDRNDPIARQLLHEQISQIGFHRLQRTCGGPQLLVECGFERPA
jgi:hypothetical protein